MVLREQRQQLVHQRRDHRVVEAVGQAELGPHAGRPRGVVLRPEPAERGHREFDRLLLVVVENGEQRLGEPREVPLGRQGLVAVGVAPAVVDRAVDRGRVEGVQEGARPVVDGLARDRHVVGVHDAVHEAHQHPPGDQRRLNGDDRLEQRQVGALGGRGAGVVAADRVVGQAAEQVDVAGGRGVLEAADAQVAAGDPGEHGAGQQRLAVDRSPGRDDGQRAGRGDAEGVHRLADDVLAQHRTDRGQTVAAAGERRAPGALEVEVAERAVGVHELAEQERAPVAETRDEPAELVPGVGLRHRGRTLGDVGADQQPQALGAAQPGGVEAQLGGQRLVEREQPRVGGLLGLPGDRQLRELAGETVPEADGRWQRDAHALDGTCRRGRRRSVSRVRR